MHAEEVYIHGGAGRRISTLRGRNFLSAAPRATLCAGLVQHLCTPCASLCANSVCRL